MIFSNINLELPKITEKLKKHVINIIKCDLLIISFIKCVLKWSENSVRFENLMGIGFQKDGMLQDFISQCEVWHVCIFVWPDLDPNCLTPR